jgi:hypothetical protein
VAHFNPQSQRRLARTTPLDLVAKLSAIVSRLGFISMPKFLDGARGFISSAGLIAH